ncbi:putative RNA-directed DNA polymerase [Tanacetum coccineum]
MSVHNSEHNSPINSDHDDDMHDSVTRISKLDISDPLHLHPNDTTTLTVVLAKLKGTENYQVWSCAMLLALEGKNKIGFIDGSCKRSNTNDVLGVMKHNQLLKLMQFLMGLNDSYMQIRGSILSRETLPGVRSAYATISSEESHRVVVDSIVGSSQRNQASAFMSNVPNSQNFQRSNQNFNAGPSRPNNMNNNRQGGGFGLNNNRPSGEKFGQNVKKQSVSNYNSVGKSSSSGFTDEQMVTFISLIKDNKVVKNVQANMAGANQHMTYTDKELDNVLNIFHLKIKVGYPNGTDAYISKIGNLRLSNGLTLYDVMLIPEYCVTLISVHKLVKKNKVIVSFDENRCYFLNQDLNLKNVLGIGEQCEGLYYYNDKDPVLNVLKDSLNIDKKDNTVCCEICQRAKQTREPFPLSDHKSKSLGDLVHLDLWGPYKVTSSEGFRFFLTVVDDYTRAVWVYLIKSKDEVPYFIIVFYNLIENQFKRKIKVFRSDNGTEFVNQSVTKLCSDKGIIHQTSCVYTPQQNGIAERKHRHLLNVARSLMFQGGIPLKMWTECILTATYLINRLPSSVLNGKSPYEMIYKKCPTLSHLRVFGCLCFATIVNNNDKFSSRSEKCVMIGYSNFKKGYRLYSLDKHQFIFSRDVKFFENIFPFKDSEVGKNDSTNVFQDVNHINFFDIEYPEIPNDDERVANDLNKGKSDSSSSSVSGSNINIADFLVDYENDADSNDDLVATQNEEVKYGLEKYVGYSKLNFENFCFVTQLNKTREPKTYFEASKHSHRTDAMNQEMDALLRNDTWELVDLPEGRKAIGSKWIYKIKFRSSGEIDRYKARLVAHGFRQKERINYEETLSPVVKMVTVRCLLNIVVSMSWPVFQLDVNNAFLYSDLERQWNAKLTFTLIENGFSQSKFDYSLYTKFDKGVFLALLVYVDDIIIIGKLKYYLGIEVIDTDKGICLNQRKYVLDLLSEYGMFACKPAKTPLMTKLVISNEASDKGHLLENIIDYQKLIGKFIYLTNTRPNISYVVHYLSQFIHSHLTSRLKIAFKILRYLKSCTGLEVHITKTSGMFLTAYFDADWAKCFVTRKSITGYCVFLNNSFVSWKSKKQYTLSKSSTEAEYRALTSVTTEVIWILKFLKDLQIDNLLPVLLHCDNNSAIKIAANPVFHERTKNLEIDLHFVREKVLKCVVDYRGGLCKSNCRYPYQRVGYSSTFGVG